MCKRLLWVLNGAIRFSIVGFTLALLGCSPQQEPVQITATHTDLSLTTETQTPSPTTATETPLPPTFTPVQATLEASQTPASTTTTPPSEATATQVPTGMLEPFTQGSILFLWNEATPPAIDGPSEFEPTVSLYMAQPGSSPEEWQVKPLLTNLRALAPAYLSTDQTKVAFLNNDLEASRACLCDFYKIQVYSLVDGSLVQIDNAEYLNSVSWLPDSQTIIYSQLTNIASANMDDLIPQPLTNNPLEPLENVPFNIINNLRGSPDGRLQAVIVSSGIGLGDSRWQPGQKHLAFFDIERSKTITVTEVPGDSFPTLKWSPNSEWLAFTHDFSQELFVANANTLEVIELSIESTPLYYFPAWSPDSKQLAFSQQNTLFLWNSETQITSELTRADYISEPSWSPDGSRLAAGFIQGEEAGIIVVDSATGQRQEFPLEIFTNSVIWSPDGQWLLFELVQSSDKSGLYVMNVEEGVPYLILDTSGKLHVPEYMAWLSSTSTLP